MQHTLRLPLPVRLSIGGGVGAAGSFGRRTLIKENDAGLRANVGTRGMAVAQRAREKKRTVLGASGLQKAVEDGGRVVRVVERQRGGF